MKRECLARNRITLTVEQRDSFKAVGAERNRESLKDGKKDIYGGGDGEKWHEIGTMAEGSFKILMHDPTPMKINDYDGPDYGLISEVRGTECVSGCLIVRPRDMMKNKTLRNWYLMVSEDNFNLIWNCVGWISGEMNILRPEYIKRDEDGKGPSWWIPQDKLFEFDLTKHIPS